MGGLVSFRNRLLLENWVGILCFITITHSHVARGGACTTLNLETFCFGDGAYVFPRKRGNEECESELIVDRTRIKPLIITCTISFFR
jgi:hypothetical protein